MCQSIFLRFTHLIIPTLDTTKINRGNNIQGKYFLNKVAYQMLVVLNNTNYWLNIHILESDKPGFECWSCIY